MTVEIPWFVQYEWTCTTWLLEHWYLFVLVLIGTFCYRVVPCLWDEFKDWWYDNVTSRKRKNK